MGTLDGKVALVTGGSRSNGRAMALGLAEAGADVAVNYVAHPDAAAEVEQQIVAMGRRALAVQADTSRREQVEAMVERVRGELGPIEILVNNAGVLKRTPFLEIDEQEWDWIIDINLKGPFLVGQAVARTMVRDGVKGSIINISSAGQQLAAPNLTHYCASKAGVGMLTKQMALELAPHGIRVNAIAAGLIETDMNRRDLQNPEFRALRLSRIPLKVIGQPDDLVGTAVYLASDASALVTGAAIFVDGGQSIW